MEILNNSDFTDNFIRKVAKSCHKYQLIDKNDKILVGLSGGKDSLFLLEALHYIRKHFAFPLEIVASHIHIESVGYKSDPLFLEQFCQYLDIPLQIETLNIDLTANPKKGPCFVCSWHRRKRLFELTKELNCNKLALGHYADDAIETLMMNMMYHGSISSMPARLKMFDGRIYLIRPLIEIFQKDMKQIARERGYPLQTKECPYNNDTKRIFIREMIEKLNGIHSNAGKNILRSMDNIFPEYLLKSHK
jgi:tRNA 2-thiocytidine biosynthesis protein TtcA